MIKAYLNNNKLVWFTNNWIGWIPNYYDRIDDNLTKEDITVLCQWWTYSDWVVTPKQYTDEELLLWKKSECQTKILDNYSWSDQANITGDSITSWDSTEFDKMRTFINAMLTEFHDNWKDADFSNINP